MNGQTPSSPFTDQLVGSSLTILADDSVMSVSVLCVSGTVTAQAPGRFRNTNAGGGPITGRPVTLPTGVSLTFTTNGAQNPLDNFIIDASAGNCIIILNFS